jgi:hypothetical protein
MVALIMAGCSSTPAETDTGSNTTAAANPRPGRVGPVRLWDQAWLVVGPEHRGVEEGLSACKDLEPSRVLGHKAIPTGGHAISFRAMWLVPAAASASTDMPRSLPARRRPSAIGNQALRRR